MNHKNTHYKNHTIQQRIDVKSHCAGVFSASGELIKMIAGDIKSDGSNNAIEKAKKFIDEN